MRQLFVGLMAEGKTDYYFLKPIVEKTLVEIAFDCKGEIDIFVFDVEYDKNGGFIDYVIDASIKGYHDFGIMILIVHADADSLINKNTYEHKIQPAQERVSSFPENKLCKAIAPLVPVFESESWMLADKQLFKKQIWTSMSDESLGIEGHPEEFSRPKERIENAIRIGRSVLPKKIRSKVTIDDLYSIMGDALKVSELAKFISYQDFVKNLRLELKNLNFL